MNQKHFLFLRGFEFKIVAASLCFSLFPTLLSVSVFGVEEGRIAPTLVGKIRGTSEYYSTGMERNEIRIFNFFSESCGPCRDEIPLLMKTAEKYPKAKLFLVNALQEDAESTGKFLKSVGAEKLKVLDVSPAVTERYREKGYTVMLLPATVAVGRNNRVIFVEYGYDEKLIPRLEKLLEEI